MIMSNSAVPLRPFAEINPSSPIADRIRQHRPLTYQKLPAAMEHQNRLLLFRLSRHETHRWPRDRLANCRSVIGVVLNAFEIGLHIARWHQLHRVAERLK